MSAARGKILFFENRVEMRENDVQARLGWANMERDLAVMYYVFLIFAGCLARIGHLELENEKCDMSYNDYFSNSINQKGKSVHIHNSMYNIYILCIHLEKYSLVYLFFFNEFS